MKQLLPLLAALLLLTGCETLPLPQETPKPAALAPSSLTITWKPYGLTKALSAPLVVQPGQILDGKLPDGKLTRLIAKPVLGDGSQKEGQKPLIIVKPGGRVRNYVLDFPAADGIHLECALGKVTRVEDCDVRDVGEDAITVTGPAGKAEIVRCQFAYATDKTLQVNGSARVVASDCKVKEFTRFARGCGTCGNLAYDITLARPIAFNGETLLKLTNSKGRGRIESPKTKNVAQLFQADGGAKIELVP